jgi:WD40 repeat protein
LLDRNRPAPGAEDLRGWEWRYLWQQCQSDALAVLAQRNARGLSVSFSPDGSRLAAGYLDGRVELWDVSRRVLLKVLHSEVGRSPADVAFSPQRNLLAATAGRGVIKLHNLADGGETMLWQAPGWTVRELSFSPDGTRLTAFTFAESAGGEAALTFDIAQGLALSTNVTTGATLHMGVARLSADHRRLYLSQANSQTGQIVVMCLDTQSGQETWKSEIGLDYGVTTMALSPDDKVLVTGTGYEDSTIRVWDAGTGRLLTKLEGHTGWVGEVVFSRDGRLLASASADQSIRLWDASEWTEITTFRGHGDEVHAVAFSPDGQFLASGGKDGAIMLWEVAARESTRGHRMLPPAVQFATEVTPGTVVTVNHPEMQPSILQLNDFMQVPVQSLTIRADQPILFSPPNVVGVYDQTNSLRIYEVRGPAPRLLAELAIGGGIPGVAKPPTGIAYCREKGLIAWGDAAGAIHIASLHDPSRRMELNSDLNEAAPFEFSPDGKLLVLVGKEGRGLEVREVHSGQIVLNAEIQLVERPLFANQARTLVALHTEASGEKVAFWDLTRPERQPIHIPERGALVGRTASPDGRLVAVCSQDGFVTLYDAQTFERKTVLHGHMQGVHSVRFSSDGKSLVSASGGREAVKLWLVETGQELLTLKGKGSLLNQVEFVDGGNALLVGTFGQQGTWQIWRAPSFEEIAAIEATEMAESKQQ